MANKKESELNEKASLTVNDFVRVVGSDGASYKQSISSLKTAMSNTYTYDQSSGSFLDWVQSNFTANGDYYVVYATTNYTGWAGSAIGACVVYKRNADYFITAFLNETVISTRQAVYLNRYNGGTWLGWIKLPTREEMDISAITPTTSSGVTDNLFIRQKCGIVTINGYLTKSGGYSTSETTMVTIPAGSRPIAPVRFPVAIAYRAYNAPSVMAYGLVNTNGNLTITAPSTTTHETAYFSISYMAQA